MFEAVVQGLVQGLTEFLPVSSSGHLVLFQHLFGFRDLDPAYNVFVQGGTVLSVLLFYGRRLVELTKKYFWLVIIASIPAGVVGLSLGDQIDALFSSLYGAALGFFLTTIIVWLSKYAPSPQDGVTPKQALQVGLAQTLALLPGLSRSGTTITAALFTRITPSDAFDLSFLMSVPVISAAAILGSSHIEWSPNMTSSYVLGFFVATVSGYFSLRLLSNMLRRGRFYIFAPYTFILCLISLYLAS